jgi:hypothetical protein
MREAGIAPGYAVAVYLYSILKEGGSDAATNTLYTSQAPLAGPDPQHPAAASLQNVLGRGAQDVANSIDSLFHAQAQSTPV